MELRKDGTDPTWPVRVRRHVTTRRQALMRQLGNKCAIEGCENDDLEFDHPLGRSYDIKKLSQWTRVKRYAQDLADGNLRLLCRSHNAADGARWRRT